MTARGKGAWFAIGAAMAGAAVIAATLAAALSPPVPDFYWPYGTVLVAGDNIFPLNQPVIAFVNGRACGDDETQYVPEDSDNLAVDAGKTVYVVNVLADGTAPGQRPGCGTPGAPVTLYFPEIGRIAAQQPAFKAGGERVNLDLEVLLAWRLRMPLLAGDGAE